MEATATTSKKVFFDEETESIETDASLTQLISPFNMKRQFLEYVFVNINHYNFDSWKTFVTADPDKKIKISSMLFNPNWSDFFFHPKMLGHIAKLEETLTKFHNQKNKVIVPPPELVFNAFNIVSPAMIRVIFLGQDPYPGGRNAMGLSFGIPLGMNRSKSQINIFNNLMKFHHIDEMPQTGCFAAWVLQGCLMINAALTTFQGEPDAHTKDYREFTKGLMKYLNNLPQRIIFVIWGSKALAVVEPINRTKHCVIASSHPSPYSYSGTMKGFVDGKSEIFPSFESTNWAKFVNTDLRNRGEPEIVWDMII